MYPGLWVLGLGIVGSGLRVRGFGFRILGLGFLGSGFTVRGFGFRILGLGFRVVGFVTALFSAQAHALRLLRGVGRDVLQTPIAEAHGGGGGGSGCYSLEH